MAYKDQTNNKSSRGIVIIAAAVCVALLLLVLYVFVFADMITGAKTLSELRGAVVNTDELTLTDPLYDGDMLPTSAQAYITGAEAKDLAKNFFSVTQNARYKGLKSGKAGFWDISLYFEADGRIYTAYLTENGFYVTKNDIGYTFTPSDAEAYATLYERIEQLISDRVGN